MWRRVAWETMSKALILSNSTTWVVTELILMWAILYDTTLRRSAVKTVLEIRERPHFSRWSVSLLFTSFSKTNWGVVFNCRIFPKILKGARSSLRQCLIAESPLKMMKNGFYFTLKAPLVLKIFKILSSICGHVKKQLD